MAEYVLTPYSPKKWAGLDRKGKFLCQVGCPFVALDAKMAQKFKNSKPRNITNPHKEDL